MEHNGYTSGTILFDEDAALFTGQVRGLKDVITFAARSSAELKQAFRDSIDDYLAFCAERGESPERPMSGRFLVRTTPEVHRRLREDAARVGLSFNRFLSQAIAKIAGRSNGNGLTKVKSSHAGAMKKASGKRPRLRKAKAAD